ncbi:MAG: DNA polymerase III subunit delta [Saprospiraceae bacterium]
MFEELLAEFKTKKLRPIYFLTGDEDYMIDSLMREAETNVLNEEEKDFNLQIFYGKETSSKQFVEACRQSPLIGTRKLILVKEAQDVKDWELITSYLGNASNSSILIIAFKRKKPDGRANWVKVIKQKAVFFESKKLYDYQIPLFIKNLASQNSLSLSADAISLLAEYLGNNLSQIENELIKIKLISNPKEKITPEQVAQYVGISRENNVFELCKALSQKNNASVYSILVNISENMKSNPLIPMIASLYNHFVKLWMCKYYYSKSDEQLTRILKIAFAKYLKEYREASLKYSFLEFNEIFNLLKEFDLKAKGVNSIHTPQEELFKELVLKICQN